ncbi:MAG: circularly permuted type 2 ATP-grasp protein [Polyangiaceae bacterium]|nr:circularly permuted type 2 ATP-grasp protein [Polyangiaceae bacterium]
MTAFNEFYLPDGSLRPTHLKLNEYFQGLGEEGVASIESAISRRLFEQEVSYNILGTPAGSWRPWKLDPVPHVIPAPEFKALSTSLATRARLIEALLQDIYGQGELLRSGTLPASVVTGNPHFFRALHGVSPWENRHLTLYAADVVKTSSGEYLVHSDRTAAPTGSGYALENRLALGNILAPPFRAMNVAKLRAFFRAVHRSVSALAAPAERAPRIAVLTPGVQDESSFEHGYLARYQGFELVEGRDLTVRGDGLFMKTLEGLEPVDVLIRRVRDEWCDPLELREDSLIGVSGLVSTQRARSVGLANALGSGIAESPVFRAYLPQIARFLGLDAGLASIPTRHLGSAPQLEEVLDTFDQWMIRSAYDELKVAPVRGSELEKDAKEKLIKKVRALPDRFVAEEWPEASVVPLGHDRQTTGSLALRLFACQQGHDYLVMPGALARVNDLPAGLFLRDSNPSTTKDVWVTQEDEAGQPALPTMPRHEIQVRRGGVDMPSRLFDDIFWLGRYVQRANDNARLLRAVLEPLQSETDQFPQHLEKPLLSALSALQVLPSSLPADLEFRQVLAEGIESRNSSNAIAANLNRIFHLTSAARSRLSRDAWKALRSANRLFAVRPEPPLSENAELEKLEELLVYLSAFRGVVSSRMVRGHAWAFLEMGQNIEHAVFVLTLLRHISVESESNDALELLLRACDAQMTYRSRYLSELQPMPVVDLLLTDKTNPASVISQVKTLLEGLRTLPRKSEFPLSRAENRLVTLEALITTLDLPSLCRQENSALPELCEESIHMLWQASDDLTQTYFNHADDSHQQSTTAWIDEGLEAEEQGGE